MQLALALSLASQPRGGGGAPTTLISFASDAVLIDFTEAVDSDRITIKTAGASASYGVDAMLVNDQAGGYPPRVRNAAGAWVWSPHNLYINSETMVFQNVTVLVGETYTVSVVGAGSLGLTGAGTGTATQGAPFTFVASTTTLTTTRTGSLSKMQLNRGAVPTAYLKTTADPRLGAPVSYNKDGSGPFLCIEARRDNFLQNTNSPATQTVSLPAATYTLWCEGSGSVALSGGPTGTATEDNPATFTLGGTTSVTFTVTGSLSHFQCEDGDTVTSQIINFGAASTRRWQPAITFSLSNMAALGSDYSAYIDFEYTGTPDFWYFFAVEADANNYTAFRMNSDSTVYGRVRAGGADQTTTTLAGGAAVAAANTRQQITVAMRSSVYRASINGSPFGGGGIATGITAPTPTRINLGSTAGQGSRQSVLKISRVALAKGDLGSYRLPSRYYTYATDSTPYDIFSVAGQSNAYFGLGLNGTDVSGGHVFQLNHTTGAKSAADEPLNHPVPAAGYIGFALAFARDYYYPNTGREVLLLPCGVSNTGFFDDRWDAGADLYERHINLMGVARAKYPAAALKSVLWMEGEREAGQSWTQGQYETAFDAMVAASRAECGEAVPYIVGGMVPPYVAANPTWQPVQDALIATPARVAHTAYADPASPSSLGIAGDVHYDAPNQRLFAARWWTAFNALT